jgi:hypothetical protein
MLLPIRYLPVGWAATWVTHRVLRRHIGRPAEVLDASSFGASRPPKNVTPEAPKVRFPGTFAPGTARHRSWRPYSAIVWARAVLRGASRLPANVRRSRSPARERLDFRRAVGFHPRGRLRIQPRLRRRA